jgi:hypothetical protein
MKHLKSYITVGLTKIVTYTFPLYVLGIRKTENWRLNIRGVYRLLGNKFSILFSSVSPFITIRNPIIHNGIKQESYYGTALEIVGASLANS